jgi:pilus assembly protein CpaC
MRSKPYVEIVGLVCLLAATAAAEEEAAVETREIDLEVGDQVTIPAPPGVQYSEGIPGVIDLKLPKKDARDFVVLAVAPGTTTLLFILADGSEIHYQVTVRPHEPPDIVKPRDNIRLDFYFVELSAGGTLQLGLAWPGITDGTGTLGASVGVSAELDLRTSRITDATALIAGEVLPRLDLAESAGWASVLRHASFVVTNGESGAFASGGEVNVRVTNGIAAGLSQIEHGTRATVRPRYDRRGGRIELQVDAEVATLGGPTADGLPGRKVTSVQTVVNLELGQAVVLAGLDGEDRSSVTSGWPWLSQVPVLGYLFGTRRRARERVENVLVIVPSVEEAVEAEDRAGVAAALRAFQRFDGDFEAAPLSETTADGGAR